MFEATIRTDCTVCAGETVTVNPVTPTGAYLTRVNDDDPIEWWLVCTQCGHRQTVTITVTESAPVKGKPVDPGLPVEPVRRYCRARGWDCEEMNEAFRFNPWHKAKDGDTVDRVTLDTADRWATALGVHPTVLWGGEWDEAWEHIDLEWERRAATAETMVRLFGEKRTAELLGATQHWVRETITRARTGEAPATTQKARKLRAVG